MARWTLAGPAMETTMLILTRRPGQSICIGENIKITVVTGGDEPTLAIDAPEAIAIKKKNLPGEPRVETSAPATKKIKQAAVDG